MTWEGSSENESQRVRQETLYRETGLTIDAVRQKLLRMKAKDEDFERKREVLIAGDTESLYLNSSDSLRNLERLSFDGKKILTVAGSGDFPLAMIDRGASEVHVLDISMPGCFFSELKIIAARELSYKEYEKMFGTITPWERDRREEEEYVAPIFDVEIYKKIKPFLSEQAALYFDTIFTPGYEDLSKIHLKQSWLGLIADTLKHETGFLRHRYTKPGFWNEEEQLPIAIRVPFLGDADRFEGLKKRINSVQWDVKQGDVKGIDLGNYDLIYLSNVGYDEVYPHTACRLIKRGARRIIISATSAPTMEQSKRGIGAVIDLGEGITAKVIGIDKSVFLSYTLDITKHEKS